MALFVYVTNECQREAEENGFQHFLDNFKNRVEIAQDTGYFAPFPPPYLVKKHFGGRQGRLIAAREVVTYNDEEHVVIVFLAIMIRGDYHYEEEFVHDPIGYGQRCLANRYKTSELVRYVQDRLLTEPVTPKQTPTEAEYGYLYQALSSHNDHRTEIICESADWVQRTQSEPITNSLVRIYDALSNATPSSEPGGTIIDVPSKPGLRLLVRVLPSLQTWFLVAQLYNSSSREEDEIRDKYAAILNSNECNLQTLLKYSRRSYPQIILADEELWFKTQQDRLGNLALSPEETRILTTAMRPEGSFPLFINGRAGSGKSTILQYLFADYLYYHLTSGKMTEPPAYFTCNSELLQEALKVVKSILKCSAKYWKCPNRDSILSDVDVIMQNSFREFREYLLSLIPAIDRHNLFPPAKRIGYTEFQKMWGKKFGRDLRAREYSPDLCWHVIRTYIKGTTPDAFLDPEEYLHLEQKQRSVSLKSYTWVFTNVWERWYREIIQEKGLWDDQDLARYVLENDLLKPIYPAIFCDEAQDFTRVELEAILRMSLFSARTVTPSDISHIPFVFAGDQFQTINPTGFRWDAVKAWFVEKFIFALDPARRSGLDDFHYNELSYNYRSTAPIVRFSNHVQALRSRLFAIPGIKPQEPWDTNPGSPVTYFDSNDGRFWEGLKTLGDVVFVLPCHEGEELSMLRDDPVLKDRIALQDGVPSIPVLSAARAKGLEFPRVVVYGFGRACPDNLLEPIRKPDSNGFSAEEALPLEYFINRLYVAVSRPKRQLIIVDDKEGKRKLWEFATDLELEDVILDGIRDGREIWGKLLTHLETGRPEHLTTTEPINILENAQHLEKDGRTRRDSYMLLQAALSYKNAGEDHRAALCRAEALRIDGEFLTAGDLFLDVSMVDDAVTCYWMAKEKGWPKISSAGNTQAAVVGRIEYAFAAFLTGQKTVAVGFDLIDRLVRQLNSIEVNTIEMSTAFGQAVNEVLKKILSHKDTEGMPWNSLYANTQRISNYGIVVSKDMMARLAFRAGQYTVALEIWDKLGQTTSYEYRLAKAESEPYPKKILALYGLNAWDRIIEEYNDHPDEELNEEYESMLGVALGHKHRFSEALIHLKKGRSGAHLKIVSELARSANELEIAKKLRAGYLVRSVETADWPTMTEALRSQQPLEVAIALGRAIGRSADLRSVTDDTRGGIPSRKLISEFLRQSFIQTDFSHIPENSVLEIGAAIEVAGNRIDALQFYELIQKSSFSDTIKHSASLRWIVCKERQIKHDIERGDERTARDRIKEVEEKRRGLKLQKDVHLPDLPEIPKSDLFDEVMAPKQKKKKEEAASTQPIIELRQSVQQEAMQVVKEAAPSMEKTDIIVGQYRITSFPEHNRVNVEHTQTGERLSIKNGGTQCEGDWEALEPVNGRRTIKGADFSIIIPPHSEESSGFELEFRNPTVTLKFDFEMNN